MKLIGARQLLAHLKWLDQQLIEEATLVLGGGAALLALVPEALATKDIDTFVTNDTEELIEISRRAPSPISVDLNADMQAFESFVPDDWPERLLPVPQFSGTRLAVYTLCLEDLVLLKTYRYQAKDAQDIHHLMQLSGFRPNVYRHRFLEMLPVVLGNTRDFALSFTFVWKMIHPRSQLTLERVLEMAGIN